MVTDLGRPHHDLGPNDALRFFFEDVAALPVIDGKRAYLPLTRRIRRAEALAALAKETTRGPLAALRQALQPFWTDVSRANGRGPAVDLARLDEEIEAFLDDPDQNAPPALQALARQVDQDDEVSDRLWRDFYWLALLPPGFRAADGGVSPAAAAIHFDHVRREGRAAQGQLVEGTLRYVVNIAADYTNHGLPYLDLVQEGFFGLARATRGFDERKGHFQQYAATWIRQRMDRAIAETASPIRIPVHMHAQIVQVDKRAESLGQEAYELDLTEWAPAEEADRAASPIEKARGRPRKDEDAAAAALTPRGRVKSRQIAMAVATAAHYSLERAYTILPDGTPLALADVLPDAADVEGDIEARSFSRYLRAYLESARSQLTDKERDILYQRFGFDDEEMTLEQIGRRQRVTRERIRQIEAKAKRKLENRLGKSRVFRGLKPRRKGLPTWPSRAVLNGLHGAARIAPPVDDLARVHHLIRVFVRRGRRTRWGTGRPGKRQLFREVLLELGRPVHYSVIHERALALVPEGKQFTKRDTYSRLFYDTRVFRAHGNAVFGLVEWGERPAAEDDGEPIFRYCPTPLLPPGAPATALFDSLEVGRRLLARQPMTATAFWSAMTDWVGEAEVRPQEAFNAWYVTGLLAPLQYEAEANRPLTLTAPANAPLPALRAHALDALARRVERLPELLAGLESLGRPTVMALASLLYGDDAEAYDVTARLRLLAGLGGARAVGDEWQLTEAGRAALAALPAVELPDEPPAPDDGLSGWLDLDEFVLDLEL